jgi:hypothetical protein
VGVLALLQQLHFRGVRCDDQVRFGTLLLDFLAVPDVEAAGDAQNEQADGCSSDSDPAPEPIHEVSLRRGQ